MEFLIISATELEIRPLLTQLGIEKLTEGNPVRRSYHSNHVTLLVTGIGMMQTAYSLSPLLHRQHFDHVIQIGIAGSFDRSLQIGEVVIIESQQYADLGVWDEGSFQDVYNMGLADENLSPFHKGKLVNTSEGQHRHDRLERVSGVSVNQISSNPAVIGELHRKYNAQVEVMEGIAFHFTCLQTKHSYAEIRGISNHVEARNKDNWDIPGAVEQVNNYLLIWLKDNAA